MAVAAHPSVVIIHEHGLLGEGIAQYLLTAAGVRAEAVPAAETDAVRAALDTHPAVVIYESNGPGRAFDLPALCPCAELIDVSSVFTSEVSSTSAALLERILAAVGGSAARPA